MHHRSGPAGPSRGRSLQRHLTSALARRVAALAAAFADRGDPWVPYPALVRTWAALAAEVGFDEIERLTSVQSWFLGSTFSVRSVRWMVVKPVRTARSLA